MKKLYFFNIIITLSLISSCIQNGDLDYQNYPIKTQTRAQGDGKYEVLGYGYDITGEYLDFYSIKKPVIAIDAFIQKYPSKYYNPFIGNITTAIYAGENYMSYMHKIQNESGYNFSLEYTKSAQTNAVFSGEYKTTKTSAYEYSTKYGFARADIIKRHRQYEIDASPSILTEYLTDDFIYDLNNLSAIKIIEKYGTHVLLNIEVGGIYKATYKSQITQEQSSDIRTQVISAGIKGVLKKIGVTIGGSSSTTEETNLEKKNINWEFEIVSNGGSRNGVTLNFTSESSIPNTTISIDNWAASVDDTHSVLVHINWRDTYPIYDFILNPTKKQEIKSAVNLYIEDAKVELLDLIPLYRVDRTDTKNTYNVYGDQELYYLLNEAPNKVNRIYDGLVGYVLKKPINTYCEPLYSIDNSKTNNTYTIIGDEELDYYLNILPGYKDRKYDGQTGYAYKIQMPHTLPMYRINNNKTSNTYSVTGDDEKNYYLYQLDGYKNRSLDGQTGYIYPSSF